MTTRSDLHQLVGELDDDSAQEALAYLQSLRGTSVPVEGRINDETDPDTERAAGLEAWEDEGGGQAAHRSGERTSRSPAMTVRDEQHRLVDELDEASGLQALAYLRSLRRPRLLTEAGDDDVAGTEEENADAVEAWQLDRRHALDER
jgi:hypothetical protein